MDAIRRQQPRVVRQSPTDKLRHAHAQCKPQNGRSNTVQAPLRTTGFAKSVTGTTILAQPNCRDLPSFDTSG